MFTHYDNIVELVLYILTGYQVLGIVFLDQLSGARHTHNILSGYKLWVKYEMAIILILSIVCIPLGLLENTLKSFMGISNAFYPPF